MWYQAKPQASNKSLWIQWKMDRENMQLKKGKAQKIKSHWLGHWQQTHLSCVPHNNKLHHLELKILAHVVIGNVYEEMINRGPYTNCPKCIVKIDSKYLNNARNSELIQKPGCQIKQAQNKILKFGPLSKDKTNPEVWAMVLWGVAHIAKNQDSYLMHALVLHLVRRV